MQEAQITDNSAGYDGGGVFFAGIGTTPSSPLIFINNIIAGNSSYRGGGVFATEGATLRFINNTITDNRVAYFGGGLYVGLWFSGSDALTTVDIINTIVYGNTTTQNVNDDVYIESYQRPDFASVNVSYSDVGIIYGNYENLGNNVSVDPLLRDTANMDYHHSSSSPIINKGDNSAVSGIDYDFEGDPRIRYDKVDMGADEHVFSIIMPEIVPTMIIDGDLSEYEGADGISIIPSAGGNSITVRTLWNSEALYLAYAVSDTNLNASITTRDGNVKNDDSAGWLIDTLNDDGGSASPDSPFMLPDDYQGLVNILNTQYDSQGTPAGTPTSSWNGSWQSAVKFSGTMNDSTDVDTGYVVEVKIPWTTLGLADTLSADTPLRIGFLVNDMDISVCDINPDGTYIDAENFTGTIIQGTGTFSVENSQTGYLGSGYLRSIGGGAGTCPPVHQGKQYQVNFPSIGTYNVWIKGYSTDNSSDSLYIGLDGTCVGVLTEDINGQWSWTKSVNSGSNNINVSTPGTHTINIWVREPNHLVDGIYLSKGSETPSDASHGTEINPSTCGASNSIMWPQGDSIEFQNTSNWQEMLLTVETHYYCDYDQDGYIASSPSSVCIGTGCQPIYCQTAPGTDCDDNDFYEHPGQTWYKDSDNDDYSDGTTEQISCARPPGYKSGLELTATSGDCDDINEFVYPWAPEIWYDGVDQDCNGWNDYDQDMDRFVHENWNIEAGGSSTGIDDCNDTNSAINPDTKWCPDFDGDGYGNPTVCFVRCNQPNGHVLNDSDCDDNDANIYPGGPPVRISRGNSLYYYFVQDAYDAASTGEIMQCQDTVYEENLFFDLNKTIYIEGGYDCAYSVITGITTLNGGMIMTDGSVTVEDFELQDLQLLPAGY